MKKLLLLLALPVAVSAQAVRVGNTFVDITPPEPFVEVSKVFPDRFDLRKKIITQQNHLIAWCIPRDQILKSVSASYRALTVQTLVALEGRIFRQDEFSALKRRTDTELNARQGIFADDIEKMVANVRALGVDMTMSAPRVVGKISEMDSHVSYLALLSYRDPEGTPISSLFSISYLLVSGKVILLGVNATGAGSDDAVWVTATTKSWIKAVMEQNF